MSASWAEDTALDSRPGGRSPWPRFLPAGGVSPFFPPLQYSCLENPMDRGAWRAIVYGVAESRTRLKRLTQERRLPSRFSHWTRLT